MTFPSTTHSTISSKRGPKAKEGERRKRNPLRLLLWKSRSRSRGDGKEFPKKVSFALPDYPNHVDPGFASSRQRGSDTTFFSEASCSSDLPIYGGDITMVDSLDVSRRSDNDLAAMLLASPAKNAEKSSTVITFVANDNATSIEVPCEAESYRASSVMTESSEVADPAAIAFVAPDDSEDQMISQPDGTIHSHQPSTQGALSKESSNYHIKPTSRHSDRIETPAANNRNISKNNTIRGTLDHGDPQTSFVAPDNVQDVVVVSAQGESIEQDPSIPAQNPKEPMSTTFVAPDDAEDVVVSHKDGSIRVPPRASPSDDSNAPTHDALLGGSFRTTTTTSTRSSPETTDPIHLEENAANEDGFDSHPQVSPLDDQRQSLATEQPKGVRFSTVEVREYTRCPGDNPSVQCGVPLSLDWTVQHSTTCSLDEREEALQNRPSKTLTELRVGHFLRTQMMLDWGFSRGEIRNWVRIVDQWREDREQTLIQLERRDRMKRRLKAPIRWIGRMVRGGRRRQEYYDEDEYEYEEESEEGEDSCGHESHRNANDGASSSSEVDV